MSLLTRSTLTTSRTVLASCSRILSPAARSFASTSKVTTADPESATPSTSTAAASPSSPTPTASTLLPSSCPAGTPLPGLAILKDHAEPIALPDEEYPPWLWSLLSTPAFKTTAASTEAGEAGPSLSVVGTGAGGALTKGQLRMQQKRERKEKRLKAAAEARAEALRAKRMADDPSGDVPPAPMEEVAKPQLSPEEEERALKKVLRKKNREAIKSKNFLKSS